MVGLHDHPVLDLGYLHSRVAPDQLAEDALVVGGQVLHQHEGHAGIGVGGHAREEGLEGGQPARRGPDADDGEPAGRFPDCGGNFGSLASFRLASVR